MTIYIVLQDLFIVSTLLEGTIYDPPEAHDGLTEKLVGINWRGSDRL